MAAEVHPKLSNPPIHEAVLDIRVRARSGVSVSDLVPLKTTLRAQFPSAEILKSAQATFKVEKGVPLAGTTEAHDVGILFRSADEKLVLQTRVDGITLSRLRPYRSFDELTPTLLMCWNQYLDAARPVTATRVAVRYINRFEVPPRDGLGSILTRPPSPTVTSMDVVAFVHREFLRTPDQRFAANVTTALEPGMDGSSTVLVLDIDAFSDSEQINIESGDHTKEIAEITSRFHELRDLKNRFFFSLLTPNCIERFR